MNYIELNKFIEKYDKLKEDDIKIKISIKIKEIEYFGEVSYKNIKDLYIEHGVNSFHNILNKLIKEHSK